MQAIVKYFLLLLLMSYISGLVSQTMFNPSGANAVTFTEDKLLSEQKKTDAMLEKDLDSEQGANAEGQEVNINVYTLSRHILSTLFKGFSVGWTGYGGEKATIEKMIEFILVAVQWIISSLLIFEIILTFATKTPSQAGG